MEWCMLSMCLVFIKLFKPAVVQQYYKIHCTRDLGNNFFHKRAPVTAYPHRRCWLGDHRVAAKLPSTNRSWTFFAALSRCIRHLSKTPARAIWLLHWYNMPPNKTLNSFLITTTRWTRRTCIDDNFYFYTATYDNVFIRQCEQATIFWKSSTRNRKRQRTIGGRRASNNVCTTKAGSFTNTVAPQNAKIDKKQRQISWHKQNGISWRAWRKSGKKIPYS